jgi:hypothetical protein
VLAETTTANSSRKTGFTGESELRAEIQREVSGKWGPVYVVKCLWVNRNVSDTKSILLLTN